MEEKRGCVVEPSTTTRRLVAYLDAIDAARETGIGVRQLAALFDVPYKYWSEAVRRARGLRNTGAIRTELLPLPAPKPAAISRQESTSKIIGTARDRAETEQPQTPRPLPRDGSRGNDDAGARREELAKRGIVFK